MARARFPTGSSKATKTSTGRPSLQTTPVTIRSAEKIGEGFERRIRTQLANRVGHAAGVVNRITVRFDDVNGPKGGVDTICRIKAVVSGVPSIVVEKRAASHTTAFSQASAALGTAIGRLQGKHGLRTGRRRSTGATPAPRARSSSKATIDRGELIGRRVGRGPEALERALARPEKKNRAALVDTAKPGVSASHRRAGGTATARRNTLARTSRATATLEDSRTRPSRKTTRRSANRGSPAQTKERAAAAKLHRPSARRARG
jgi:hypothetical protein